MTVRAHHFWCSKAQLFQADRADLLYYTSKNECSIFDADGSANVTSARIFRHTYISHLHKGHKPHKNMLCLWWDYILFIVLVNINFQQLILVTDSERLPALHSWLYASHGIASPSHQRWHTLFLNVIKKIISLSLSRHACSYCEGQTHI